METKRAGGNVGFFYRVVKLKLVFVPRVNPKIDWMFWFSVMVYVVPVIRALAGVRVMVLLEAPPLRLGQDGEQLILVLSEVDSMAWVITMVIVGFKEIPVAPLLGFVDSMVKLAEVCVTNGSTKTPNRDGCGSGRQVREEKTNRIEI